MHTIKYLTIQKISDSNGEGNKPTHKITVKGADGKYVPIGKLWTKDGQYGKYLSGQLSDIYRNGEKFYDGYVIISETELQALLARQPEKPVVDEFENFGEPNDSIDYPENNLGEQPF